MSFSFQAHQYMSRAIKLAQKGRFTTSPNPNVGCVIVKDGDVIGEGWHKKAGTGHAEVNALANLDIEQSTGASAFVTLEPCSHFGRTPPCAQKLIDAGIKQVFVAMLDPNPLVAGKGIDMLRQAGIEVEYGLLEQEARTLNPGFLSRMEKQRPFVQVKLASSLDGKTALANGESKWITSADSRSNVQLYRALSCAILSTAQTVIADNAKLNVRENDLKQAYPIDDINKSVRQPIKIILDSQNQINIKNIKSLALFENDTKVYLIRKQLTSEFDDTNFINEVCLPYEDGFDLTHLLKWTLDLEINTLWVEAGGTLAASFVEQQLFDQLICYLAPKVMGKDAQSLLPITSINSMSETINLNLSELTQVGKDIRLIYTKLQD